MSRLDDLWVKVKDGANQVAELSLGLNVDDVNDNKPQFETDVYTVNVTRFTASGKLATRQLRYRLSIVGFILWRMQ